MQFGQQKEVKFNSVKTSEQNIIMDNKKEERESKSGSRDSKSKSKEVQSGQLAHAICNMTETLASYKVLHIMRDIQESQKRVLIENIAKGTMDPMRVEFSLPQ